jgi:hypothetical protein
MSNRFHSKYHRQNHHTYGNLTNPDAGHDPIASFDNPFLGDFVLKGGLSAVVPTNSAYAATFFGPVGIGTSTPNTELTVVGSVCATENFEVKNNIIIGGMLSSTSPQLVFNSGICSYNDSYFSNNIEVFGNQMIYGGLTANGDTVIGGSLLIAGTAFFVNTQNLELSTSIFTLAENNPGDILDIGFLGSYDDGTPRSTGLIRNYNTKRWTLFSGMTSLPLQNNLTWNDPSIKIETLVANLSGTVFGNLSGNAATVTNGVYTNLSYNNPSWIVTLADSKITGENRNSWDSVFSRVNTTSAIWTDAYTRFATQSTLNASVYSNVNTNSSTWVTYTSGDSRYLRLSAAPNLYLPLSGSRTITSSLSVNGDISLTGTVYSQQLDSRMFITSLIFG